MRPERPSKEGKKQGLNSLTGTGAGQQKIERKKVGKNPKNFVGVTTKKQTIFAYPQKQRFSAICALFEASCVDFPLF